MTGGPLETAIIVASLLLAAACLFATWRHRATGRILVAAVAVLEVAVLVQVVIAAVRLAGGGGPEATRDIATFIGYLIGVSVVLPATAAWSIVDRSRWGPGVIAVGALVLPVLIVRLQQIWELPVG